MKHSIVLHLIALSLNTSVSFSSDTTHVGPRAAIEYQLQFRGNVCHQDSEQKYPEATGIPFSSTKNIRELDANNWQPWQLVVEFNRLNPKPTNKRAIIVILKTERCATNPARYCSVTTAAFEKLASPVIAQFEVFGAQLAPRDREGIPGREPIETGEHAWKNSLAGQYQFRQGPGATIVVLHPTTGEVLLHTDAVRMNLNETSLIADEGRVPTLEAALKSVLDTL